MINTGILTQISTKMAIKLEMKTCQAAFQENARIKLL